jgi:hypothetical protein
MNNNAYTWTDDFSGLCEKYAEFVMDSMDMKTMEQFVFDTLYECYSAYDEEQLISEIRELYDDETLESFGVKITDGPDIVTPD